MDQASWPPASAKDTQSNARSDIPPAELDKARVLAWCQLSLRGKMAAAAICRYDGDNVIYLFYCDRSWNVVEDWDYSSLAEAKEALDQRYPNASSRLLKRA